MGSFDFVKVEVEGVDKIVAALDKFPRQIAKYLAAAGKEAAKKNILSEPGLKRYPPKLTGVTRKSVYGVSFFTEKQRAWFFYALRNKLIDIPYKRGRSRGSERFGTQWYVNPYYLETEIGNRASYAKWLAGEDQSKYMARMGWRKLIDVAQEKMPHIQETYRAWVKKLIVDLGLNRKK